MAFMAERATEGDIEDSDKEMVFFFEVATYEYLRRNSDSH
jgi:hypothetical protein